jgi:hypothetical protein
MASEQNTTVSLFATSSAFNAEVADFSATDHVFAVSPRAILCDADGSLKVDFQGTGTAVIVPVTYGINPLAVSKIYTADSDAISVIGLS